MPIDNTCKTNHFSQVSRLWVSVLFVMSQEIINKDVNHRREVMFCKPGFTRIHEVDISNVTALVSLP